jgi:hypothetical protein
MDGISGPAALTVALIVAAGGVVQTIAGVLVTWVLKSRESKVATTASLNNEWHTGTISRARHRSDALLFHEWGVALGDIRKKDPEGFYWIWRLLGFFARLHNAIELGTVKEEDVPKLFGQIIVWWWVVYFDGRARPGEFCAFDALCDLQGRLARVCKKRRFEAKYNKWVDGAERTRHDLAMQRTNALSPVLKAV